jgi:acyl dehydratase
MTCELDGSAKTPPPAGRSPAFTGPTRVFDVPIERAMVAAFAHAVVQTDPTTPPPSFIVVADRFDPDCPRRPPLGRGWAGEGPDTLLHVEERTALRDAAGRLRIATGRVDVHAAAGHARLTNAQREPAARGERVAQGRRPEEVLLVEGLTPTQIVLYVAAAGDFHPLHHDDAWARARGYPSIFAPGMPSFAWTVGAILRAGAIPRLGRVESRFRAQVWPGDSLYVSWTPCGADGLAVRTRNQWDETVLETRVRADVPTKDASFDSRTRGRRARRTGGPA